MQEHVRVVAAVSQRPRRANVIAKQARVRGFTTYRRGLNHRDKWQVKRLRHNVDGIACAVIPPWFPDQLPPGVRQVHQVSAIFRGGSTSQLLG